VYGLPRLDLCFLRPLQDLRVYGIVRQATQKLVLPLPRVVLLRVPPHCQLPLLRVRCKTEEVKIIWIFYQPLGKIRLRGRKSFIKIGQCMPLATKQLAFNRVDQDIPTPATLRCLPKLPFSLLCIFYGVQNPDLVTPRRLCNNLSHKLLLRVRLSKCAHIFQDRVTRCGRRLGVLG
jgi:hypothetical protein